MSQQPPLEEDRGFVTRGFVMLGLMAVLAMIVLLILFQKPAQQLPVDPADIAPQHSSAGWQVRYNAALALARRGSIQTPWQVVAEMLDEKQQLRNFRVTIKKGEDVPDEASARRVILNAMSAIRDWRDKQKAAAPPNAGSLEMVRNRVNALTASPVPEIRIQAEKTKAALAS